MGYVKELKNTELSEMQIDVAAEWWAKVYENPQFQTVRPDDTSRGSRPAATAQLMATAAHRTPTDNSITIFKNALKEKLQGKTYNDISLMVDYHPSRDLGECLDQAGDTQGMTALPWKTNMQFEDNGVQVSCGYGEPYIELVSN